MHTRLVAFVLLSVLSELSIAQVDCEYISSLEFPLFDTYMDNYCVLLCNESDVTHMLHDSVQLTEHVVGIINSTLVMYYVVGPRFEIGRYDVTEGQNNLCVRLSEPILNSDFFLMGPGQNIQGKVEVDVCFEDGTELPIATRGE